MELILYLTEILMFVESWFVLDDESNQKKGRQLFGEKKCIYFMLKNAKNGVKSVPI